MKDENALAAGQGGAAPAPQSREKVRRLTLAVEHHVAESNALLQRCLDLKSRTPRDTGLIWAAARLIANDAALGNQLAKSLKPPRCKAKRKRRQSVKAEIAELNSRSSIFDAKGGTKDDR